ncbi:MAG: hypothetical protein QXY99_04645 [Thermoproteota archaeon]
MKRIALTAVGSEAEKALYYTTELMRNLRWTILTVQNSDVDIHIAVTSWTEDLSDLNIRLFDAAICIATWRYISAVYFGIPYTPAVYISCYDRGMLLDEVRVENCSVLHRYFYEGVYLPELPFYIVGRFHQKLEENYGYRRNRCFRRS